MIEKWYSVQWSETDVITKRSYSYIAGLYKTLETARASGKLLETNLKERHANDTHLEIIINIVPIEMECD